MSKSMRSARSIVAFLIGLILLPASLSGQEAAPEQETAPGQEAEPQQEPAATTFLVASRSLDPASGSEFRELIDGYMKFELEQHRLAVLLEANFAGVEAAWPGGELSAQDLQEPAMRAGRQAKADFVILCTYRQVWPEMEMRFDCYDVAGDSLLRSQTARRNLALLLDWSMTDVIGQILQDIGPRLVYLPAVPERPAPQEGAPELAGPVQGGPPPGQPGEEPPAPLPPQPRPEPPPPPVFTPVEPVVRPFEVSLSLSPLFVVGQAANYFRLGFFPSVNGAYRLYTRAGHISLGASLGLMTFFAQSPSAGAQGYLLPLAATVGFLRPFPGSRLTFQLRAAGGAALFVLAPKSVSAQSKILGYLGTGLGAELALSEAWGVRLELDYAVFFERIQPIMGYAPALYGFYRF
jgi:hypothetical protein